ncbi:rhodanese-like domain-containing protein [Hymenobacter coccineus]|uniref:rhodanese-like domain-containing protein n=1 Tax=Hymenobacter coccineus TaxID=1908235 RepID=UPI0019555E6C|nr:rhodanese-like domain-containing protein [Hymenobacter coccineus]
MVHEKNCFPTPGGPGCQLQPVRAANRRYGPRGQGGPRSLSGGAGPGAPTAAVNTPKAKELLAQPTTVVLDVRTPAEFLTGHLSQARNINVSSDDFAQEVAKLDTAQTYVLYCRSGKRSSKAADIMYQQGFHRVVNGGGYADLTK